MMNLSIGGTLGKDAELRQAGSSEVVNFSVAVSGYDFKAKQKTTTWIRVAVWGKRASQLAPMLTKGSKVAVSGELSVTEYQGKTQLEVRAQDVTLLGGKPASLPASARSNAGDPDLEDDEVPF